MPDHGPLHSCPPRPAATRLCGPGPGLAGAPGGYPSQVSCTGDALTGSLKRAAVALKRAGVPFALAGGFAVYARGGPPSEHDVDFLLRQVDVSSALDALRAAGFRPVDPPEDWLVKVYDEDRLVDLIFVMAGAPVDDAMLARADELEVCSVRMPVLDATDIIVSKLLSLGPHHCDLAPVLSVARSLREQVRWSEVRDRTKESPYARALLFLLAELEVVR